MNINNITKYPKEIIKDYIEPLCLLTRDHYYFNNKKDNDICNYENCKAKVFCHPYSICFIQNNFINPLYSFCKLYRQEIKYKYITTFDFCIPCLQNNICCFIIDYPSKYLITSYDTITYTKKRKLNEVNQINQFNNKTKENIVDNIDDNDDDKVNKYNNNEKKNDDIIGKLYFFQEADNTRSKLMGYYDFRGMIKNIGENYQLYGEINKFDYEIRLKAYGNYNNHIKFIKKINEIKKEYFFL